MNYSLTVITPTRDRPEAFDLCKKWMSRQTYERLVQWIIVDDGDIPTSYTDNPKSNILAYSLRRNPSSDVCTLQDNLLHAIPHIQGECVLIFEDDEFYAPGYLSAMASMLDEAVLVGEKNAHYYNVASRRWHNSGNTTHASLCRTGFRKSLIGAFRQICMESKRANDVFVDIRLWSTRTESRKLAEWSGLSVGIKGMPGRGGLGKSHALDAFRHKDPQMNVLRSWIGKADAAVYEKYYQRPK